jgi:hypothetical protein
MEFCENPNDKRRRTDVHHTFSLFIFVESLKIRRSSTPYSSIVLSNSEIIKPGKAIKHRTICLSIGWVVVVMDSKDRGCDDCIVSNQDDSNGTPADEVGNLDVEEPPKKRARKDSNQKKNPHRTYYEGWTYESVQFTWNPVDQTNAASIQYSPRRLDDDAPPPPPCTPLRYFQSSFRASQPSPVALDDTSASAATAITLRAEMIVHQHRNGLCVVTVANGAALWQHMESTGSNSSLRWKYLVEATPADLSMAQTRKRNSKLLSQSSKAQEAGVVTPNDVLATLEIVHKDADDSGTQPSLQIQFPCAVLGSILELNRKYERATTMEAWHRWLVADPYSTGYLAVILSAGPFPPNRGTNVAETNVTIPNEDETV